MADRSYDHYCGLARALDVIGDRWTLLVVRELVPGPMRYGELAASIDGIATNLLADRLRRLEADGVVERRLGESSGVVYALTTWGRELREPIEALVRWSAPRMVSGRRPEDAFEPRWLAIALPALLDGRRSTPPVELGVEVDGTLMTLRIDADGPELDVRPEQRPDGVLSAAADALLGLAAGALTIHRVLGLGATFEGDQRKLEAVLPGAPG